MQLQQARWNVFKLSNSPVQNKKVFVAVLPTHRSYSVIDNERCGKSRSRYSGSSLSVGRCQQNSKFCNILFIWL